MTKTKAMTKTDEILEIYPILQKDQQRAAEIIKANLGGERITPFELEKIDWPCGGSSTFEVPTVSGPDPKAEVECVIIEWERGRKFYDSDELSNAPPDCVSRDLLTGVGKPGGRCVDDQGEALCPKAVWGSATSGKGQACKQFRTLFLLLPGAKMPMVLVLPVTSIKLCKKYFFALLNADRAFYSVRSLIRVDVKKNDAEQPYAILNIRAVPEEDGGFLSGSMTANILAYANQFTASFDAAIDKVSAEDVGN